MATQTRTTLLSAAVVCLLVAGQAAGQGASNRPGSAPDELHFNGDDGNDKQLNGDTNIISDNTSPANSNTDNNNNLRPPSGQYGYDDTSLERPSPPFVPFHDFAPLGLPLFGGNGGGLFGALDGGFSAPSPQQRPFTILDNLFGSLRRHSQNMHQNFERQFQDLERQAGGEGEEVSYFNRNGVAYVKKCTIKRVTPASDGQKRLPDQVQPMGQQEGQLNQLQVPLQQQQQQQQSQQPPAVLQDEKPRQGETSPAEQANQTS